MNAVSATLNATFGILNIFASLNAVSATLKVQPTIYNIVMSFNFYLIPPLTLRGLHVMFAPH